MKTVNGIRRFSVVGAGTMGSGIAPLCPLAGYETVLYGVPGNMGKEFTCDGIGFLMAESYSHFDTVPLSPIR